MLDKHITNVTYKEYDESKFYPVTYPCVKKGLYLINVYGDVKSTANNMQRRVFLKKDIEKRGYLRYNLRSAPNHINKLGYHTPNIHVMVQRLVAWEFVGKPINYKSLEVNHADSSKTNNYYKNLEWCSNSENELHKKLYGNIHKGENHPISTHKEDVVREIISMMDIHDAPFIARYIISKYPQYYNSETKYDYDRIRSLISKIKRGVSWNWIYTEKSSTTIETNSNDAKKGLE